MKDSVTRACFDFGRASLSTDFGLSLALKKTGLTIEQLSELCGVYKRGPRKGKIKGVILWAKTAKGGWQRTGAYDHDEGRGRGFVVRLTGVCFAFGIMRENYHDRSTYLWGANWTEGYPNDFDHELLLAIAAKEKQIEASRVREA